MNKSFWIPLIASLGTIILLYAIGFLLNIELLILKVSVEDTRIALLPIAVGILVGFIAERIIKYLK